MRMLYPDAIADVSASEVYADVPTRADRPAVRLNMIVSIDGGTSWNGVSGALGGRADKALFGVMRSFADVILVASGTMRAEHYGPALLPAPLREARVARGQTPVPAIAVVSGSGDFDWQAPFFTEAEVRPIIVTVASAVFDRARTEQRADVVVAGETEVDLIRAIEALGERGARNVLAEGGPTLNGELAHAGILDELCVTLAPSLASGDAKRLLAGSTLDQLARLRLVTICEEDDYLFLRYRRAA
jgi:riboflavin biosynthesis pyrimidine reductase